MIKFIKQTHEYFYGDQRLKPATEILKEYGLTQQFFNSKAALKGTYIHKAIHLYLLGTLDESTIDPVIKPYFDSFKKFWEEQEAETWEAEHIVGSFLYGVAGTLDWYGKIGESIEIWDWKTGKEVYDSSYLQLEIYKKLLEIKYKPIKVNSTKVLHITPDGANLLWQEGKDKERTEKVVDAILTLESYKRRKK